MGQLLKLFALICALNFTVIALQDFNFDLLTSHGDLDSEILKLLNEDLLEMRKDITASFVADHSRRKREAEPYEHQLVLEDLQYTYGPNTTEYFEVDGISRRAVLFQGDMYMLEQFGIHKIDFYHPANYNATSISGSPVDKNLAHSWTLLPDSQVIAVIERNDVLFILVVSSDEDFAFLFTYSPAAGIVLRQRMRSHGRVTDGKFFIYYESLYLVIAHDNQVHSITVCPIFKWMGTYFDEIHTVHTRGASSVDAFPMAGYFYIAIAQAVDNSGNYEVGTQLLRMDRYEEIEKVQLLYSKAPTELLFTQFLHEYILIIAQETENAMVYFFGGYDFIFLQHMPFKGRHVTMVSVMGPDGETYILVSNGTEIYTFYRAESSSPMTSLMFFPYESPTYKAPEGFIITGMTVKPPKVYDPDEPYSLVLAISLAAHGEHTEHILALYSLVFEKRSKVVSSQKPPEDSLSKCMMKLEETLLAGQTLVHQIERSSRSILRKSTNMNYDGQLVVEDAVTVKSDKLRTDEILIQPNVQLEHEPVMSPTELLESVRQERVDFKEQVHDKLGTLLLRNESRVLQGSFNFANGITVTDLNANRIELNSLNGIPWQRILTGTLKVSSRMPQVVTGNWSFEEIQAETVETPAVNGIKVEDILLTETPNNTAQVVYGGFEFTNEVNFVGNVTVPRQGYINDLHIGDIVLTRPGIFTLITGKKTADVVHGGPGLNILLLNGIRLDMWYNSVLKTKGPAQQAGNFIFEEEVEAYNVTTRLLNGQNWDLFVSSVLLSGKNQTLQGNPSFSTLAVNHLTVNTINGAPVTDLITTNGTQNIYIPVNLQDFVVNGNMNVSSLNGLRIPEDVVMVNEPSDLYGPVTFYNLSTNQLDIDNPKSMAGADITRILHGQKTVIYTSNQTIRLTTAKTEDADIVSVNGVPITEFTSRYWTKSGPNTISIPLNLSTIPVYAREFKTSKINGIPVQDYVTLEGNTTVIKTQLEFKSAVTMLAGLNLTSSATLNGVNVSDFVKRIVHRYDTGRVLGNKTFAQPLNVSHGIWVRSINGYLVPEDFVFLSGGNYSFPGGLRFKELKAEDMEVEGPTVVNGTVNGLNLQDVAANTATADEPLSIKSDVIFLEDVAAQGFNVGHELNGLPVADILSRLIRLDNGGQPIYVNLHLVVEGNLIFDRDVTIGLLNGVDPSAYFSSLVNRSQDEDITGTKVFHGPVTVQGDLICPTINNISLKSLEDVTVWKTKPNNITGPVTFSQVGASRAHISTVCGIPLADFVRIDGTETQVVNSVVVFTPSNVSLVVKGNVELKRMLNGRDLNKTAYAVWHIPGDRQFASATCTGNLDWTVSKIELQGFSYLFTRAVKLSGNILPITAAVIFAQGFEAENITTTAWLNGVDLKRIEQDGVFAHRPVNFTGKNYVKEVRISKTGSLISIGAMTTEVVNDVNLIELNDSIVRRHDSRMVEGTKSFVNGLVVEDLVVDQINGCNVRDIARVDDNRTIEDALLEQVENIQDLNFKQLKDVDWAGFLSNRVTVKSAQIIQGNWVFEDDLNFEELQVSRLNGVNMSSVVLKSSSQRQVIHGVKTISSLNILGSIETLSINGLNIDQLYSQMIFKDTATTFNQTVYMESNVTFKQDMIVEKHFNELYLETIEDEFSSELSTAREELTESQIMREKTQDLLRSLYDHLEEAALWLDYLKTKVDLQHLDSRHVRATVLDQRLAQIVFSRMFAVKNNECSLPAGCLANAYSVVEYSSNGVTESKLVACQNAFYLASEIFPIGYKILSNALSYNETCMSRAAEETRIISQLPSLSGEVAETLIGTIQTGFVTDAKSFHRRGFDYIVISQLYDKRKSSGSIQVYAVINDAAVELVQEILTMGTVKLEISFTEETVYLAAGNTLTHVPVTNSEAIRDDLDHCETFSTIYVWIPPPSAGQHGHFSLLRDIATRNVIDVHFTVVNPFQFYHNFEPTETFAVFVHSITLIEIFKWEAESNNFLLFQTIALDDEYQITAVTSLNLRDTTYLVISSIPQGLIIYEYRCIEGFQRYLDVPLNRVYDVTVFHLNNQVLLPIASTKSQIALAKIQGPRME